MMLIRLTGMTSPNVLKFLTPSLNKMKTILISTAAVFAAAPVLAGPYVNVEANPAFDGGDYTSTLIEKHVGFEGELGEKATWYIQGGPATQLNDASGTESKVSGKVGVDVALTEQLGAYGEVSAISADSWELSETDMGIKTGFKYTF